MLETRIEAIFIILVLVIRLFIDLLCLQTALRSVYSTRLRLPKLSSRAVGVANRTCCRSVGIAESKVITRSAALQLSEVSEQTYVRVGLTTHTPRQYARLAALLKLSTETVLYETDGSSQCFRIDRCWLASREYQAFEGSS